jgi:hypothetical protein
MIKIKNCTYGLRRIPIPLRILPAKFVTTQRKNKKEEKNSSPN